MTLPQGLLLVHLLVSTVWLGGGLSVAAVALRAVRSGDPVRMYAVGAEVEWFGSRMLMPAASLTLVTGVALTWLTASFGDLWIVLSLGAFAVSLVLALVFLGPRPGVLARLAAEHGPTATPVQARIRRHFLYNRIEIAILLAVLAVMVLKPGR